ncbi:MAG: hypothetical protein K2P94_11505 [Rhodospirillaceae bacterium]|nr:hypothetical protein [Rhodospirillaceae bacterium]
MKIPDSLTPVLDYIRRHVSNELVSNERLLLMLAASAVLIWLSALYGLWSMTGDMRTQLNASKASLARLRAEVTGDAWPKRVEDSRMLRVQLGGRLWEAETAGLAEASFENWLRSHFGKNGAEPQQIQITRSPAFGRDGQSNPSLAGIQRMTAKVLGVFDQATVTQVLADIVEADKVIVVDRMILRAGANGRLEMDVSTFVRTAEARPTPQGKP